MKTFSFIRIVILMSFALLISCPTPINTQMVTNVHDRMKPVIHIITPDDKNPCAYIVKVSGIVEDMASENETGGIKSLAYEIQGSNLGETLSINADGSFNFFFETRTLNTHFTLKITATDWNGNTGELSLSLYKDDDNGIPSFKAYPGNHEISLVWEDMPNNYTENYTLYYAKGKNNLPGEHNGTTLQKVKSPFKLSNLENGQLYTFMLQANSASGEIICQSSDVMAIPLSPQNLVPRVSGEFQQIKIEWNMIAGTDEYNLLRSSNKEGPFERIASRISDNFDYDENILDDHWYYYKIQPLLWGSTESYAWGAQRDPFGARDILINTVDTKFALALAVSGSYAYVADADNGLLVVDISDPCSPKTFPPVPMEWACDVAISGNYAYVADRNNGLKIVDISNPASAFVAKDVDIDRFVLNIGIWGDYAYLSDIGTEVLIFNIKDLLSDNSPIPVNTVYTAGSAYNIAFTEKLAYVANGQAGLKIIDISDPVSAKPIKTNNIELKDVNGIAVSGDYAYLSDGAGGFKIIDIRNPEQLEIVKTIDTGYIDGIAVFNDFAYLANDKEGLQIVSIDDPASAAIIKSIKTSSKISKITFDQSYAYVGGFESGFHIIDTKNPSGAQLKKTISANHLENVCVHNSSVYLAGSEGDLQAYDISNPLSPKKFLNLDKDDFKSIHDIAVSGPYAYVVDFYQGLKIVDIRNPEKPIIVRTIEFDDNINHIAINGAYAYLAAGRSGIYIIDINDPPSAFIVKCVDTLGNASTVEVSGSYAYVGDSGNGLVIIDISNPYTPRIVQNFETGGSAPAFNVAISGSYAYLADGYNGLRIIDISKLDSVHIINTVNIYYAFDVIVSGNYAYAIDNKEDTLEIIDITNPLLASKIQSIKLEGYPSGIDKSGSFIYLSNFSNGLQIVDLLPE